MKTGTPIKSYTSSYGGANTLRLRNSLIVKGAASANCDAELTQNVGNFIADGSCSPLLSGDPMIDEAGDSPTWLGLQAGSPAIGAADPRFCLETDQLGRARPLVGGCDIGAIEAIPVRETLSECTVTTTHLLNFRDEPNGDIIGGVQANETLRASARAKGWFEVGHRGASGWISADYVVAQGECG